MAQDTNIANAWLESARRALSIEQEGLVALFAALEGELGQKLSGTIELVKRTEGRVIVSGMGKSGHIARKIAATLASTGTPAAFVHPAEASHGDLGMITTKDVVLLLSNSGESAELKDILNYCARFSVPMIAMTADEKSTLARAADIVLLLPKAKEACPNGLAPTTSTLLQLALGDALAMALLEDKGFTASHFRAFHPGGKLGAQIRHARDIMHKAEELPLVKPEATLTDIIAEISTKRFGCVGIVDANGKLAGMITDGDLRRSMASDKKNNTAAAIMTHAPRTIDGDMLAGEVIELINTKQITSVFVVDENGKPIGLIHVHDLLRIGVA
jgi:arabinose-5-phosphate isomerase